MANIEPFTVVSRPMNVDHVLFDDYKEMLSGKGTDIDIQFVAALRAKYPELIITCIPSTNVSLLAFAAAGYANAELDIETESVVRWRGYISPNRRGGVGTVGDAIFFAKYRYTWGQEEFILYTAVVGLYLIQYVLKEPQPGETLLSHSSVTDRLIAAIGAASNVEVDAIYVFDGYWYRSVDMWKEVQKSSWDKVILDPKMKKDLTTVSNKFFDSEDVYKEYGVPWKRGLIFHGPPGNGKTISIKALMRSMSERKPKIPTLYVKSAPYTYSIGSVFALARQEAPCLLILEDIDTIVTSSTRSYFFNEVDGVTGNDGIFMVASTNHLDRLDPGLAKRPSRFDRKYFFPLPDKAEREMYCEFWREKIKDKPVDFPKKLCAPIADITDGFSFAYIQEAFLSSLLVIARGDEDEEMQATAQDDHDEFNKYQLWRVIKKQVKLLRDELDDDPNAVNEPSSEVTSSQVIADIPMTPPPAINAEDCLLRADSFSASTEISKRGHSPEEVLKISNKESIFNSMLNESRVKVRDNRVNRIPGSFL